MMHRVGKIVGLGEVEFGRFFFFSSRRLHTSLQGDWSSDVCSSDLGAPITIHTLASLMISESDNTATDALIDLVTRNSVETISPRNRPFMTTREFFQLKRLDMADSRAADRKSAG